MSASDTMTGVAMKAIYMTVIAATMEQMANRTPAPAETNCYQRFSSLFSLRNWRVLFTIERSLLLYS